MTVASSSLPVRRRGRSHVWRQALLLLLLLAALLVWRAHRMAGAAPLMPWHVLVPVELQPDQIDAMDWEAWLHAEQALMASVRRRIQERIGASGGASSRYTEGGPLDPAGYVIDWNRSFRWQPEQPAQGSVVLLHGLTDSPYSVRHLAQHYQSRGFRVVAPRMPGHGTVPAGLTGVSWQHWRATTRLAVRTARDGLDPALPLHLVGYSNGGALALHYALDALDEEELPMPARIVLVSPMIGVTSLARFAGVLGWPALFPAFAHAAWIDVLPEYNPFKYNSFPIVAARESAQLTRSLQAAIASAEERGSIARLPPLLSFQSLVDATVDTSALVDALHARLPAGRSELVLFDVDRRQHVQALLREAARRTPESLLPEAPRGFAVTIIGNQTHSDRVSARSQAAGSGAWTQRELTVEFPEGIYSLSHVALPFPPQDALYGYAETADGDYGLRLGRLSVRGERNALLVSHEELARVRSNPWFDYLLKRVDEGIRAELGEAGLEVP